MSQTVLLLLVTATFVNCQNSPRGALSCQKFCNLLHEDFNAASCQEMQNSEEQLYGFRLKAKEGSYLEYLGYTFPNESGNVGQNTPINVCLLSLYGDSPTRLGPVPTGDSFYTFTSDVCNPIHAEHWSGNCEPRQSENDNPNCTNDYPLYKEFVYGKQTYTWSSKFCASGKRGCEGRNPAYATEELTCYFRKYPDCRGRVNLGAQAGGNSFGQVFNVMTNEGGEVVDGNPIVQRKVADGFQSQASQWVLDYVTETVFRLRYLPNPAYVLSVDTGGEDPSHINLPMSDRILVLHKNKNYATQQWRVEGSSIVSAYAQAEEAPFGYSIVLYTSSTEQGEPFVIRPRAESTTLLEDPDESVFADVPDSFGGTGFIQSCALFWTLQPDSSFPVVSIEDTGALPLVGQSVHLAAFNWTDPFQCWWWIAATGNDEFLASEGWYQIVPYMNPSLCLGVQTIGEYRGATGDLVLQALGTRSEQYWRPAEMSVGSTGFQIYNGLTRQPYMSHLVSGGAEIAMMYDNSSISARNGLNSPFQASSMEWFIVAGGTR